MEINEKKFTYTRRIINSVITVLLAGFLIMLANNIIDDLDGAVDRPEWKDFSVEEVDIKYRNETKKISSEIASLDEKQTEIQKMIDVALLNKNTEQESFDNWIKARGTLGRADQDSEVLIRLKKLDQYKEIVQSWELQKDSVLMQKGSLYKIEDEIAKEQQIQNENTNQLYESALNSYDIKVFLIRLLFTAPILVLGVYFFMRKRKHKFGPLFMGFSWFSVYVFFVGLVPYLPSYGGYIRYTVGILLTVGLGYYAIKRLKAYQERRAVEMKASMEVRASKMQGETAERAFSNHVCPSCGKDFLLKNWESLQVIDSVKPRSLLASNYCRHCGMQLIKKCNKCNQDNYAHLPFCINCGESLK